MPIIAGQQPTKIRNIFTLVVAYASATNSLSFIQPIKSKIVSKYLEITTSLCNNNSSLCETAKDNFKDIKENFGITWDFIKELTKNGISNLKDWYEIWRYN